MADAEAVLRPRLRAWIRVAVPAVLVGSLGAAFTTRSIVALPLGGLGLAWGAALWAGIGRPWARVIEVTVLFTCVALVGPAAMGLFIVTVCAAAISLRLVPAIALTAITTGTFAVIIAGPWETATRSQMPPFMVFVPAVVLFAIGRSLRHSVLSQAAAQEHAAKLSQANLLLTSSLQAARELATTRERGRIARELHDSLGHCLTVAHVQVQLATRAVETRADSAGDALGEVGDTILRGIAELRRCVAVMRDPQTDRSLAQVMHDLISLLPQDGVEIRLSVEGHERALAPEREFVLFRALQEALTNVSKHAEATDVQVRLRYGDDGRVRLDVHDDGIGSGAEPRGFGLKGLAERVEAFGGTMNVTTASGAGFRLSVELEGSA